MPSASGFVVPFPVLGAAETCSQMILVLDDRKVGGRITGHNLLSLSLGTKEVDEGVGVLEQVGLGAAGVDPRHHTDGIIITKEAVEGLRLLDALPEVESDFLFELKQ